MAPSGGKLVLTLLSLNLLFSPSLSWDNDDLELFDLVEEINGNFYEIFGIEQSAASSDVRKAYRRLSLQYHPDKNDAEDAEEKFRQIVAIYEVLKDEKKREKYNQVLVEGLPDWRQPVYYYRRARKMGIYELCIVLFIIITIGQYFVAWGVYVERRLVMEEALSTKRRKEKKKKKQTAGDDEATENEELSSIPTPHLLDLWPFRLSAFLFYTVYNMPETLRQWQEERKIRKEEEEREKELEEEEDSFEIIRKPKKRAQPELPEYTSEMYAKFSAPTQSRKDTLDAELQRVESVSSKKGDWSDEELVLLSKAVNRFPGGTHQRWEKIAEMVGRSVNEVTAKAKETKGNYSMHLSTSVQSSNFHSSQHKDALSKISNDIITIPDSDETLDDGSDQSQVRKRNKPSKIAKTAERTLLISQKTVNQNAEIPAGSAKSVSSSNTSTLSSGTADTSNTNKKVKEPWTQNQQTIFEWALKQYPKGTDKRWDLVAENIPGKSKEDCIARFKELAELISKKKKSEKQDANS